MKKTPKNPKRKKQTKTKLTKSVLRDYKKRLLAFKTITMNFGLFFKLIVLGLLLVLRKGYEMMLCQETCDSYFGNKQYFFYKQTHGYNLNVNDKQ